MARYNRSEVNRRILAELEDEEAAGVDFVDDGLDDGSDIDFEPEEIETENHNSESEEEMDAAIENGHAVVVKRENAEDDEVRFYVGKDGKTIWARDDAVVESTLKSPEMSPGPKGDARGCVNELECFSQIITPKIIYEIVEYTNAYIQIKKTAHPDSRERDWKLTDVAEMMAFIGALFLMSTKQWNSSTPLPEFFAADGTGLTILRANFSETRFRFLQRNIRFDDVSTRRRRIAHDKLAPVRELVSDFVNNCQKSYDLSKFVTVDEMLIGFRGKCSFIHYMANKPAKYGIKMYAMCDARTFYTYNLEIRCTSQHAGPFVVSNCPLDVVARMTEPINKSCRNVTVDNYFSSYALAEYLATKGLTFLSTLKKTQKEIPADFVVENSKLVPGKYMFGAQQDKTLLSMVTRKKKVVIVLSTLHKTNSVDEESGKPYQVVDYMSTKGTVETVDKMCVRCTTTRRTRRWPVMVFYRLLDLAGINSFRIFQANNSDGKTKRRAYLTNLALALMEANLKYRATLNTLPADLQVFLKKYKAPEAEVSIRVVGKAGTCFPCGRKKNIRTTVTCYKCGQYVCKRHSERVVTCHSCVGEHEEIDTEDM